MNLGLTQKQAIVVLKFGKYGFESNQQLEKVFVIPKELFSMIKDSTFYSSNSNNYIKSTYTAEQKEVKKVIQIELNTASESELITIPGIGPFFASNIIKQREKLGGFFQLEQLLDIWKFSPELIEQIKPYVTINPNNLRTLNINTASVVEIKAHPYMTWNIANSIVKIRKQKGNFTSINEIKESVLVSEELFNKLKPYLTL
jgi:DNA uptake protein ComE-like DNA-binding protein